MNPLRLLTCFVLFALVATVARGAGSRRIVLERDQFAEGELRGVVLDADGALHLSPRVASVQTLDAFYAWSMARDARGRLWIGSGDAGTIFRSDGEELVRVADTLALEILCLLPDGDRMLAGSSPDGIVYAIDADGQVQVALDLPQQSIWDLAPARGGFLAASGPGARIVRVDADSPAGEVWAELPATNALRIVNRDGAQWIGTESPALLYHARDEDAATLRVLYEAPEQEIRRIVPLEDGSAYVLSLDLVQGEGEKGRSRISWIAANGVRESVYVGDERLLDLALLPDGALVAVDAAAREILRIDREQKVVLHRLEQGDPVSLRVEGNGDILVGTGNLASLLRLKPGKSAAGQFESAVIETRQLQQWGVVDAWPPAKSLRFRLRSGVRSEPDETWSDWSAAQELGSVAAIPVAPYAQIRVEFSEGAPALNRLVLNYRERNLPPRVRELRIASADASMMRGSAGSSPGQVSQTLEDGLSVEFSVQRKQEAAEPEEATWARGVRAILWKSEDPNGDRLSHVIEGASWPDGEWSRLADEVQQAPFAWDTRAWPDGPYRIRVRASDARDNAAGDAREGEALSAVLQVDNGAPEIRSLRVEDGRLRAELRDGASPLTSLAWRDDEHDWQKLEVADGVLDSSRESLDLPLPPGSGRIRLRLVDAAGNVRMAELERD